MGEDSEPGKEKGTEGMVISDRASSETKTKTNVVGAVGRGGGQFDLTVLNQWGKEPCIGRGHSTES